MPTPAPLPIILLPDSKLLCFVVPGAFAPAACEQLLDPAVRAGFRAANTHYPTYYRNNERLALGLPVVALLLFWWIGLRLRECYCHLRVLRRAAKWRRQEPSDNWMEEEWIRGPR